MLSKPNAFHGSKLDILVSNTSITKSFEKASLSRCFLPSNLKFHVCYQFPLGELLYLQWLKPGFKRKVEISVLDCFEGSTQFFSPHVDLRPLPPSSLF